MSIEEESSEGIEIQTKKLLTSNSCSNSKITRTKIFEKREKTVFSIIQTLGSGGGSVASHTLDSQFESHHRQKFIYQL